MEVALGLLILFVSFEAVLLSHFIAPMPKILLELIPTGPSLPLKPYFFPIIENFFYRRVFNDCKTGLTTYSPLWNHVFLCHLLHIRWYSGT